MMNQSCGKPNPMNTDLEKGLISTLDCTSVFTNVDTTRGKFLFQRVMVLWWPEWHCTVASSYDEPILREAKSHECWFGKGLISTLDWPFVFTNVDVTRGKFLFQRVMVLQWTKWHYTIATNLAGSQAPWTLIWKRAGLHIRLNIGLDQCGYDTWQVSLSTSDGFVMNRMAPYGSFFWWWTNRAGSQAPWISIWKRAPWVLRGDRQQ